LIKAHTGRIQGQDFIIPGEPKKGKQHAYQACGGHGKQKAGAAGKKDHQDLVRGDALADKQFSNPIILVAMIIKRKTRRLTRKTKTDFLNRCLKRFVSKMIS